MGLTRSSVGKGATDSREVFDSCIALAGNPNVGKSTLFNNLTGRNEHTGNWPGKTVALASGVCKMEGRKILLTDLPGTYSLLTHSREEEIARDFLCSGEVKGVVVVCDASCLERNLNLVLQIMSITPKVIVALNFIKEAEKKGIVVDTDALSEALGVPVIPVDARDAKSCRSFKKYLLEFPVKDFPQEKVQDAESIIAKAEKIAQAVVTRKETPAWNRDIRIDRVLTGKITGYAVMFLLLMLIFWITIVGANAPSAMLNRLSSTVLDWLRELCQRYRLPFWVQGALVDGMLQVLFWVVSVMLPPMAIFFPLFTILEDSGYLPRIAYNLDRPFACCHACGKQALTMCMGFGCNAAGVVGCRIIDSPRERLLAILTNSFVPCNGRFPALIALLTMFFVGSSGWASLQGAMGLALLILLGIAATFAASWILSRTILKGMPSSFALEMPPYRMPQIGRVILRSITDRTVFVLGRAAAVAAPAGLLIWLISNIQIGQGSVLTFVAKMLDPIARWFGLDGVILTAFILGIPANEIVIPIILMTYLQTGTLSRMEDVSEIRNLFLGCGWTMETAACTLLFFLFHWPCSTTLLTIHKETKSIRWTVLAALLPTVFGFLLCALIHFATILIT